MATEKDPPAGPGAHSRESVRSRLHRSTHVGLAVVLGVALTGYVVGLGGNPTSAPPAPRPSYSADKRPDAAVLYTQMRRTKAEPVDLSQLVAQKAEFPTTPTSLEDRRRALDERATRRAFQGAPPVIPHRIEQRGSESCLVCHQNGLRVGERSAPKMSHAFFASCTQCHVESRLSSVPLRVSGGATETEGKEGVKMLNGPEYAAKAGTSFEGVAEPAGGVRAWPGAPPLVPHSVWMRTDCMSCHGPYGRFALRTPHPERQNCLQCHGPSAILNQAPVIVLPPIERDGQP